MNSRRGMASLELVLVAPFLLALVTGLFLAGRAAIAKAGTATQARHDAFRNRETVSPGKPFGWAGLADTPGEATATVERPVASGYMLRRTRFAARTEARVVGQPWDHRAIRYEPTGKAVGPHTRELGQMLANIPGVGGVTATAIDGFALAFNPVDNPGLAAIAAVGRAANPGIVAVGVAMHLAAEAMKGPQYRAIEAVRDVADFFDLEPVVQAIDLVLMVYNPLIDACENLYFASQGKEGRWGTDVNGLKKLQDYLK
ncbi:MAG TPA: hypothetical protein VM597_16525 [Gemmataceae bacterium]|jgi:hypothetical protein|nr:hypothetical protein [Gemmataceae bacterium]